MSAVLSKGQKRIYKRGDVIIQVGKKVEELYYLHHGQVKITMNNRDGLEKTLFYLNDGSTLGEVSFFSNTICNAEIVAKSDCEVYLFPYGYVMEELIVQDINIARKIISMLSMKGKIIANQLADNITNDPLYRVGY